MAVGVNHMIAIQALDRFEVLSIINCLDFRVEGCNNLCVFLHYMGYLSGVVPMYTRQISLYFFANNSQECIDSLFRFWFSLKASVLVEQQPISNH